MISVLVPSWHYPSAIYVLQHCTHGHFLTLCLHSLSSSSHIMIASHTPQDADIVRPTNPMSIRSLLNEHDRPQSDGLAILFNVGQRPLPPMIVPNDVSDSIVHSGPRPLAYRTYSQASLSSIETSPTISSSDTVSRRGSVARAPRPKYSDDQGYFIWYHRTDLAEPWDRVLQEFAKQFNHRRPKGGLQCKFYRLLGDWGVEKVREQARQSQSRSRDSVGRYGLVQRTNLRFPWMRQDHISAPMLPQFATRHPSSPGDSPCTGCHECLTMKGQIDSRPRL